MSMREIMEDIIIDARFEDEPASVIVDRLLDALMEPTEVMILAANKRYSELARPIVDGDMGMVIYLTAISTAKEGK